MSVGLANTRLYRSAICSRKKKTGKSVEPAPPPPTVEASFRPFPKLPIEIRQELLGYLIPEARVVTIWSVAKPQGREGKEFKDAGPEAVMIPTPLLHAIFFDFNRDTLRFSRVESLERFCGANTSTVPESTLAHLNEVGGKVRFLETHNSFRSFTVGLISRFYNLDLLTSNYEPKPHTERLLIKQWTERAKENGREVKIPKYRLMGRVEREMGA
ncbi:hypothetical protein N431DRAFT_557730 [Stipitochalara longipes BDJ]|nr:hypothetical protein N431DRAFT_557730 [Stipitochalara longipes BDJ]